MIVMLFSATLRFSMSKAGSRGSCGFGINLLPGTQLESNPLS
jgi:hypothetical protein